MRVRCRVSPLLAALQMPPTAPVFPGQVSDPNHTEKVFGYLIEAMSVVQRSTLTEKDEPR